MLAIMRRGGGHISDRSEVELFASAQFAGYLESHKRSKASLLAVYQLTEDTSLLREAFERFDDPVIALHVFSLLSKEEQRELASHVEKMHGDHPIGELLSGVWLANDGRLAEAVEKLREASRKGILDLKLPDQMIAQREALMSIGKSNLEARLLTMLTEDSQHMHYYRALGSPAIAELKSLVSSNNIDAALALASDVIAFSRNMSAEPGNVTGNLLAARSLEVGVLKVLPPDVEIGDSGMTASELLAQLKQPLFDLQVQTDHFGRLDEAGLETYMQVRETQGERAAMLWTEQYTGPPTTMPAAPSQ